MNKNIIIEGEIKSGKSFVLNTILGKLNLKYGGFITYPFYINEIRIGFKLKDLLTNEEEIVAMHNIDGNLLIFSNTFEDLGVRALENAYKYTDLIVMDELGFLEDESKKFKNKVIEILNSNKWCFVVIKNRKTQFLELITKLGYVYKINNENREEIIEKILSEVCCGSL